MKAKMVMALIVAVAVPATASAYRRGYSRRGGGYGYGLGGFSPGGIISAMGQYNLNTSKAAMGYQQAYSAYLDNRKKYQSTYFEMRRNWASWRAEMRGPPPTEEQIAAYNKARLPKPLSPSQFDPAHGVLHWPQVLRNKDFDNDRHRLEGLFTEASANPQESGLGTENYREIEHSIDDLHNKLRAQIDNYSPDEYIPAEEFLRSLAYQARSPVDTSAPAK